MMVLPSIATVGRRKAHVKNLVDNWEDRCRMGSSKNGYFFERRNRHSWGAICWLPNSTLTVFGLLDQTTGMN